MAFGLCIFPRSSLSYEQFESQDAREKSIYRDIWVHLKAFKLKLNLFAEQQAKNGLSHFPRYVAESPHVAEQCDVNIHSLTPRAVGSVSTQTIRNRLHEVQLCARVPATGEPLTVQHRTRHLAWYHRHVPSGLLTINLVSVGRGMTAVNGYGDDR
ncbi:uncharacterized protein TNCV_1185411 [Trichonephila clavipes]|nr:uncharacterized protein TNCV_1185411 [Trichonephila clavipes]